MGLHLIEATLLLLFLTTIAVPWAGRTGMPTEILLVLGSLALSLLPGLPPLNLDPTVVFTLFLPPRLFAAAYFTSWRDFKQNRRPIFLLAFHTSANSASVSTLSRLLGASGLTISVRGLEAMSPRFAAQPNRTDA